MDKRILKTKQIIKETLQDMLLHNNLDDLSVTVICERANINRSTFYSYYHNPRECFEEISSEILLRFEKKLQQGKKIELNDFFRLYLEECLEEKKYFTIIHKGLYYNEVYNRYLQMCNKYCNLILFIPKSTENLRISYHLFGFFGMLHIWFENGCKESPDSIVTILDNLNL